MKTIDKQQQKYQLIRKYHTLCGKLGMSDGQRTEMLIRNYNVESSKELGVSQLIDLCDKLNREASPAEFAELDKWRKRVLASVGGYLKVANVKGVSLDYIKAVVCRAADAESFNKISAERLKSIYYGFKQKQKDFESAGVTAEEMVREIGRMN